mmetsp:Transcript_17053/g.26192  ORF Transcript_17053/g.26192 Transcript_17053/m.26192 type:complete len:800 (+) Transcript_17053:160-2559(+)
MSPRNDSSFSRPFRRPSLDPTKPSFDEKTVVTVSRTPSPTEVCMAAEEAPPRRKKGGKGMLSSLRASVVGKQRRKSSNSRNSGSLHLSNSSMGSSNGMERSGLSAHQGLNLSNHSPAAYAHLRESNNGSDSEDDDDDVFDRKSSSTMTRKSGVSDNSVTSNTSGSRPGLGRLTSFSKRQQPQYSSHSSHFTGYTEGMISASNESLPSNSDHNESLTDQLHSSPLRQRSGTRGSHEEVIDEDEEWGGEDGRGIDSRRRASSIASSIRASSIASSMSDDASNELDERYESEALLERLGDKPSEAELSNITTTRVNEVIQEQSMADRRKFAAIPRYTKTDVIIGKHLGKGSFSDVFEVTVTIEESESKLGEFTSLELNDRIQAKFGGRRGSEAFEYKPVNKAALPPVFKTGGGSQNGGDSSEVEDLDKLIDSQFGPSHRSSSAPPPVDFEKFAEAKFGSNRRSSAPDDTVDEDAEEKADTVPDFKPAQLIRPRRRERRVTTDLSSSVCVGSMSAAKNLGRGRSRRLKLAMKCLHPISRSDASKFMIGVEDLIHETVLLSSFNHPNIIKIHGRAELGEGYFILLDKLKDTLDDRIEGWKKKYPQSSRNPPSLNQIKVAKTLAETVAFLHQRNIVFHDLKPPNVGFDEMGELKLFDFGFAMEIIDDEPLEVRAGTVRYMAPEVGLDEEHGLPADVYSFSILLWEIFSLKKPFAKVKRTDEFKKIVFEKGERPKLGKNWSLEMKEELESGWSEDPKQRPSMDDYAKLLAKWQREVPARPKMDNGNSLRASLMRGVSKRISWENNG